MKKFEGILITTDLDGTLLRNDTSISRENLEAIEYFKEKGQYAIAVDCRSGKGLNKYHDLVRTVLADKINKNFRSKPMITRVRHAWPEKKGFILDRKNGVEEYIFLHFWQPVKINIE